MASSEHFPRRPRAVAYFSPEFGVAARLPQYSGGLGILAGDHLKAAADLGLPLVGVGVFYRNGYFRQHLSPLAQQSETYHQLDPATLGLEPLPGLVELPFPDATLRVQVWRHWIGSVPLLLLDTDVASNPPGLRSVADSLYSGDGEHRLRQEILLGVGGARALAAAGIKADVFHINEGHAALLGLERLAVLVRDGLEPEAAMLVVRATTIFTTHTPVPAGIDRFDQVLITPYLERLAPNLDQALIRSLGEDPDDPHLFNMAAFAIRLGERVNGVSALHGRTSRSLFRGLWPGLTEAEVPIGHVTNGVHAPTWLGAPMQRVFEQTLGPGWASATTGFGAFEGVDDDALWAVRLEHKALLAQALGPRIDPEMLTIGFARRVPTYKRLTLMLHERERLARLLASSQRPVQLVVAGKAHPSDEPGKALLAELGAFAADPALQGRIVILADYDMNLARVLVAGVDVWLNTPRRPYEASGTSGMKALLNGCLNLSIRDGWWDEIYDATNGWAIPSAEHDNADQRDRVEARALLALLEDSVVPLFYQRRDGIPRDWVGMIRRALVGAGACVSAARMLRQYEDRYYLPAAADDQRLRRNGFAAALDLAGFARRARTAWPQVHVLDQVLAAERVQARVALGGLGSGELRVDAIARSGDNEESVVARLRCTATDDAGTAVYEGALEAFPHGTGISLRILPWHPQLRQAVDLRLVHRA